MRAREKLNVTCAGALTRGTACVRYDFSLDFALAPSFFAAAFSAASHGMHGVGAYYRATPIIIIIIIISREIIRR